MPQSGSGAGRSGSTRDQPADMSLSVQVHFPAHAEKTDFKNNEILIKRKPLVYTRTRCTLQKKKKKKEEERKTDKEARTVQQQ